jgi:hypothetical protein
MAMKTRATILIATIITPKFAPIVRDAKLRIVTPRIAIIAVIYHQLSHSGTYLECPFWYQGFWVGRDGVVDHPVDVFSVYQLWSQVRSFQAYPKISEMIAVLPGFREDTALHVYR